MIEKQDGKMGRRERRLHSVEWNGRQFCTWDFHLGAYSTIIKPQPKPPFEVLFFLGSQLGAIKVLRVAMCWLANERDGGGDNLTLPTIRRQGRQGSKRNQTRAIQAQSTGNICVAAPLEFFSCPVVCQGNRQLSWGQ